MKKILILNGPNINLIGKREPTIYGYENIDEYLTHLKSKFPEHSIDVFQTNSEGTIIDKLQAADGVYDSIILNAGAYTHTSLAIADAIAAISVDVIEVHISNIHNREGFRQVSYIAKNCCGVISGFGLKSYQNAVLHFIMD